MSRPNGTSSPCPPRAWRTLNEQRALHNLRAVEQALDADRPRWRPLLGSPDVAALIERHYNAHFLIGWTLTSIHDAELLPDDGRSVLLRQPPVTSGEAALAAQLARVRPVIAAIEHYHHAELLLDAFNNAPLPLALSLRTRGEYFGMRPGLDVLEISRGLRRFDNVSIAGLTASVRAASELRVLHQTQTTLQDLGQPCALISVAGPFEIFPGAPEVECQFSDLESGPASPAWEVTARVLQRPRRDVAVINAGEALLPPPPCQILLHAPDGPLLGRGEVVDSAPDRTAVRLEEDARLLVIGDTCRLLAAIPPQAPSPE